MANRVALNLLMFIIGDVRDKSAPTGGWIHLLKFIIAPHRRQVKDG